MLIDQRPDGVHLTYDEVASLLAPYENQQALEITRDTKNVDDTFCRFISGADMGSERSDDGLQLSIIQFGTARCGPWLGFRAGCAKDRLSSSVQRFLDVEPIEDLDGLRKQFRGGLQRSRSRENHRPAPRILAPR